MGSKGIPSVYDPAGVEEKWYRHWLDKHYFRAEVNADKQPYCIVIPPPNITGSLHLGHALNNTIQDILTRFHRMRGFETLWLPGYDHASIATHMKIEEMLAKEGTNRYELGREKFLERAWAWKEKYGGTIVSQLKRMGCSCDWSRERFTMDEGCSRAVIEVFVRLYEKGLIYRGDYITNWCPSCRTVISDIEVEHEDVEGSLWYVRYPFAEGDGYIQVATTRPETILGDTAVAVHPSDERYRSVVGRMVILPHVGRKIPVIADEYVDPAFGTGAVKVTPGHDPNDFEAGVRHKLPVIKVIGQDGRMTPAAGKYEGLDRYECRKQFVKELEAGGFIVKVEPIGHSVGHCYRCRSVVEPLVTTQWFVRMAPLAEPAIKVVKDGDVRFVPERYTKVYLGWMENIRDWCISRQLWWGHRIPAWYCLDCGETIVARTPPEKCACGSNRLEQDPDVLDTWFSSALWPFSTLGWPDDTPELRYFYPTSVLVTAYDIIFFWVARMIFSGLEFMGKKPFSDVLITGLIKDSLGRKMSKTLGNGVDPLEVIRDYGADTLRFTLVTGNTPGSDQRWFWEKVQGYRNFCNKIWNASRFVLMNLGDAAGGPAGGGGAGAVAVTPRPAEFELEDRWILSRLEAVTASATRLIAGYELGEASRVLYEFVWSEFCDWYIELVKPRLHARGSTRAAAQWTLVRVLEQVLRLLHPFMPFITEEIWQALPHEGESIVTARWPEAADVARGAGLALPDAAAVRALSLLMEAVRAARNLRAEINVPPGKDAEVFINASSAETLDTLESIKDRVAALSHASPLRLEMSGERPRQALAAVIPGAEVFLPLKGLIDVDKEIERLRKELGQAKTELEKTGARLANAEFLKKAPREVVEKETEKQRTLDEKVRMLEGRILTISGS
ncbi:MAG: valine--tRNA ligase [Firmicutes bacterium]|nr:valine--tRNA ligase [Bacillota bacterium]